MLESSAESTGLADFGGIFTRYSVLNTGWMEDSVSIFTPLIMPAVRTSKVWVAKFLSANIGDFAYSLARSNWDTKTP